MGSVPARCRAVHGPMDDLWRELISPIGGLKINGRRSSGMYRQEDVARVQLLDATFGDPLSQNHFASVLATISTRTHLKR